jgi:tetratricopeptide (TPR) repeat protein
LLASVLVETGHYDEARSLAHDARAIYLKSFGPQHWRTASAANAEGAALTGLKQYQQAEALLQESHAVLHRDTSASSYYVKSSNRWLGDLYRTTGRPEKAAKLLAQATRTN